MNTLLARTSCAMVFFALFSGNAVAQRMERVDALPPGAAWVNQVQNSGSYGSGSAEMESKIVQIVWDGRELRGVESAEGTLLIQGSGERVGLMTREGKVAVTWDPPLTLDWPVEVGKSSVRTAHMKLHAQDRIVPVEIVVRPQAVGGPYAERLESAGGHRHVFHCMWISRGGGGRSPSISIQRTWSPRRLRA